MAAAGSKATAVPNREARLWGGGGTVPEVCGGGGAPHAIGIESLPWIATGRPPLRPHFFQTLPDRQAQSPEDTL